MMKYSEQFMEHIEYAFAAFCKIVLAMRQSARTAILDGNRSMKYRLTI